MILSSETYVIDQIQALLQDKEPVILAIDGCSAAGKSTLAREIASYFNGVIIPMDHFFLTDNLRTSSRLNETGGHVDYERFQKEIIPHLSRDFTYNRYDCQEKSFKPIQIQKSVLTIIEGAYANHPYFHHTLTYDFSIFLYVNSDIQQQRIARRNPHMLETFIDDFIPKENAYIEAFSINTTADYLIDTSDLF